MNNFSYTRATTSQDALHLISTHRNAKFLGGGTNLVDLMRENIEQPEALVDVTRLSEVRHRGHRRRRDLDRRRGEEYCGGEPQRHSPALPRAFSGDPLRRLGPDPKHGDSRRQYHAAHALLLLLRRSGSLQQTRSGIGLRRNRRLQSHTRHSGRARKTASPRIPPICASRLRRLAPRFTWKARLESAPFPSSTFTCLPGQTPHLETVLAANELITAVEIPALAAAKNSLYRKVRDRASYAFALVSVAAALELEDGKVRNVRIALGGVAPKPWRASLAEQALIGAASDPIRHSSGPPKRNWPAPEDTRTTASKSNSPSEPSSVY